MNFKTILQQLINFLKNNFQILENCMFSLTVIAVIQTVTPEKSSLFFLTPEPQSLIALELYYIRKIKCNMIDSNTTSIATQHRLYLGWWQFSRQ